MAYYIARTAYPEEAVEEAVSGLSRMARLHRETGLFLQRIANSRLVGRVASSSILPDLEEIAQGVEFYYTIEEREPRPRVLVIHEADIRIRCALATAQARRIQRDALLDQARKHFTQSADYSRRAAELPGQIAQINNLIPALQALESAAQTVDSYANRWQWR